MLWFWNIYILFQSYWRGNCMFCKSSTWWSSWWPNFKNLLYSLSLMVSEINLTERAKKGKFQNSKFLIFFLQFFMKFLAAHFLPCNDDSCCTIIFFHANWYIRKNLLTYCSRIMLLQALPFIYFKNFEKFGAKMSP